MKLVNVLVQKKGTKNYIPLYLKPIAIPFNSFSIPFWTKHGWFNQRAYFSRDKEIASTYLPTQEIFLPKVLG